MAQVSGTSKKSTTADETFIKPFNATAKQDFDQRLGKIKESLKDLNRALLVLESAGAPEWQKLNERALNIQGWIEIQEQTSTGAEFSFKKGYQALEGLKESVYKVEKEAQVLAGSAAPQHAQTLLTRLKNDVGNKQFPKAVFDDLEKKFTAVSTNTGKSSKETENPYVPFILEATTALKKRDEARTKWQTYDPKKTSDDAKRLEALAKVLNLAAVAAKAKAAVDGCAQAQSWLLEGRFAEACGEMKAANLALAGAQKDYDGKILNLPKASDVLKGLRQPAAAKLQCGNDRNIGWLITAAEKVTKGIDAAVALENFGPLQHPASRQAALKVLPEIVALNDQWDVYQQALTEWNELDLVITQYLGLAKTIVASAKKHQADQSGNVPEWQQFEKQAQDFPASIKPAQDLAAQNKPRDAITAAYVPKAAFVTLRGKFNKASKVEVSNDFQTLSGNNPNGPEAQLNNVLTTQQVQEMLMPSHNLLALAKQEGLPIDPTLSHGDALAIYAYTNEQTCNDIQAHLRNPNQTNANDKQRLATIAKLAEDAMAKLPSYTGTPTKRGEKDWGGADKQYQVDNQFTIDTFWSTSVSNAFGGLYQITVKAKPAQAKGKLVNAFSQYVKEGEVVFPPKTKFKVKSRTKVSDQRIDVEVEEI